MVSRTEYIEPQSIAGLRPGDMLWDAQLKRFGARCRPSATTYYFIKARIDGRQRWITLGRHGALTPADARAKAESMLADIDSGRDPRKPSSITRRRKKCDPLDEPIVRPNGLVVALETFAYRHSPAAQVAIERVAVDIVVQQKITKIKLLADRHGVDLGAPDAWCDLCLRLAEHYLDGFKVIDAPPRGPGGPRKDQFDLVKAIEARVDDKGETVKEACRRLTRDPKGRWHRLPWTSLQSRYYEWHRQRKHRVAAPILEALRKAADLAVSDGSP
jgi:hypothetical protein